MSKILFYRCKSCKTKISSNTGGVFRVCKCGKLAVDGTDLYTRLIGNPEHREVVSKEEKPIVVYRIKQLSSGLYFKPVERSGSNFSRVGKVYTRMPSLSWVGEEHGTCVVESYTLQHKR